MLSVQNLKKSFGDFMAVSDANLEVDAGQMVAVIGPNGAGKTTLFKLITGQLKPDKGLILFKGEHIGGLKPHRVCGRGISLSYQVVNLFSRMTVLQNVQVAVLARQKKVLKLFTPAARVAMDETWEIIQSVGLEDKAHRVSGTLSHGDSKVLELAVAPGQPARAVDHGRAHRGHEPGRDPLHHGPDPAAHQGAGPDHTILRARHGAGSSAWPTASWSCSRGAPSPRAPATRCAATSRCSSPIWGGHGDA